MIWSVLMGALLLCLGVLLVLLLRLRRPWERLMLMEALVLVVLGLLAVWAASQQREWFFNLLIVLPLVGFLASVVAAQTLLREDR